MAFVVASLNTPLPPYVLAPFPPLQAIVAGFLSEHAARDAAHPPVLLGDILSDLPPVSNFELHDRCDWATPPQ